MDYESELSKKDIQRLINKGKSVNPIEAIKKKKKKKALMAKLKKALPYAGAGAAALVGYGLGANKDKIKAAAGKVGGKAKEFGGRVKAFGGNLASKFRKQQNNDVKESAVDYIDNLLDTFYEAYYYDLLDDSEYEAFVESVYEADDMDEIEDIETVFESYIE